MHHLINYLHNTWTAFVAVLPVLGAMGVLFAVALFATAMTIQQERRRLVAITLLNVEWLVVRLIGRSFKRRPRTRLGWWLLHRLNDVANLVDVKRSCKLAASVGEVCHACAERAADAEWHKILEAVGLASPLAPVVDLSQYRQRESTLGGLA